MAMKKNNWLRSLIVNTVILAVVLVCTHMVYETNDDYALASRIADGYAAVNFVNYYLCLGLVWLQKIFTGLNVYIIAQLAASFVSFVCIYKLILDGSDSKVISIASAAVLALFSIDHYCTVQFTKTAAVVLAAGALLLTDGVIRKRGFPYYIAGIVLLYLGAAFRIDGLMPAIGFAGLFLLGWLFFNRKILVEEGYLSGKKIISFIILLAVAGGCYVFDGMSQAANRKGPELESYKEYSILRSAVVDFPVYENYENNAQAYEDIGISENDLNLIDHWYFDYDGAASPENLAKIVEISSSDRQDPYTVREAVRDFTRDTIKSVKKLDFTGIHIILLIVIAVWALLALSPKHWLYIFATGGLTVCMYLLLYYMQRPQYRALYIADISAAVWLLYSVSLYYGDKNNREARSRQIHRKPMAVMGVCTALAAALLLVPLLSDCTDVYEKNVRKIMPQELTDYITENDSSFFVFGTTEKKSSPGYLTPWKKPDTYADRNVMGTGSWGSKSPYVLDKLAAYGMTNPIRDLVDNDNAFYIGNKRIKKLTEYYNKWYGTAEKTIRMEKVATKGGFDIWKIVSNQ